MVVDDCFAGGCTRLCVEGLVARLDPDGCAFLWNEGLIWTWVFLITFVDDEIDRLGCILDRDIPKCAKTICAIIRARVRPFCRHTLGNGISPQVQPPSLIVAFGAVVVNG